MFAFAYFILFGITLAPPQMAIAARLRCGDVLSTAPYHQFTDDGPSLTMGTTGSIPNDFFQSDELALTASRNEIQHMLLAHFSNATRVECVTCGPFSGIFEVEFSTPKRSIIVKLPLGPDYQRRFDSVETEKKVIRRARRIDSTGSRHLVTLYGTLYLGEYQLPALAVRKAEGGPLMYSLAQLGPERSRADPALFLQLWKQVALGLRAVHRSGFIHRDLKPSNIVIAHMGRGSTLQLIDFGLSAPANSLPAGFRYGISGTFSHMSENQLSGGEALIADDMYALIMTFREMLIGSSVWYLDPTHSSNHVTLEPVNEFGTYPQLTALPDSVNSGAHPMLIDIVESDYESTEELLKAIDRRLRFFPRESKTIDAAIFR